MTPIFGLNFVVPFRESCFFRRGSRSRVTRDRVGVTQFTRRAKGVHFRHFHQFRQMREIEKSHNSTSTHDTCDAIVCDFAMVCGFAIVCDLQLCVTVRRAPSNCVLTGLNKKKYLHAQRDFFIFYGTHPTVTRTVHLFVFTSRIMRVSRCVACVT